MGERDWQNSNVHEIELPKTKDFPFPICIAFPRLSNSPFLDIVLTVSSRIDETEQQNDQTIPGKDFTVYTVYL
jgi:hypothetical protein